MVPQEMFELVRARRNRWCCTALVMNPPYHPPQIKEGSPQDSAAIPPRAVSELMESPNFGVLKSDKLVDIYIPVMH